MNQELIINELLTIEAWADGLREKCRKTRKLIEGGVSTPPKHQALSEKQLANLVAKKNKHILKRQK